MVVIGIDPHKSTHTAVAVDQVGKKLGQLTIKATDQGVLQLLGWAGQWAGVRWAVEDGRGIAGRLVRQLITTGAQVTWIPPKLMAKSRASARTRGKSDPIDALAVARAALREPDLPAAHLDQQALDLRLLTDRREHLVATRTKVINQLRWHLHDLDPLLDRNARTLTSLKNLRVLHAALTALPAGTRRDVALDLVTDLETAHTQISTLQRRMKALITPVAPTLLDIPGVDTITAAKLIGETAGITRFRDAGAFARHNGTAPIPVWTSGSGQQRLNRGGNRQLNTCIHRIAITQLAHHQPARDYRDNWTKRRPHATRKAALRALKRHLSNVLYRAMTTDSRPHHTNLAEAA
jgi:transposase